MKEINTKWVCRQCGSDDLEVKAYISVNDKIISSDGCCYHKYEYYMSDEYNFNCNGCDKGIDYIHKIDTVTGDVLKQAGFRMEDKYPNFGDSNDNR